MKLIYFLAFYFYSLAAFAMSFQDAIKQLEKHESIQSLEYKSKAIEEMAEQKGSWGDPKFKLAAKNFPRETLNDDETPMTGIEFGISQKISLTPKFSKIKNSFKLNSEAVRLNSKDHRNILILNLWNLLISERRIIEELKILEENMLWIQKILNVSKKLYSTGKTNQQGLLDIQIRKSEIENQISNKKYEKLQVEDQLKFLIGEKQIDKSSIPWNILKQTKDHKHNDYREEKFKALLNAKEQKLAASKLNYIPDMTFSVGYTKRSNIDGRGDFLGASVSFPLPFSGEKYAAHSHATQEKYQAEKQLKNFQRQKDRDVAVTEKEIAKITNELKILSDKTIKFAQNSRSITSKSYGLGNSSYVELLQSEFKLQKILLHKANLKSKLDIKKINLKYLKGDSLNE